MMDKIEVADFKRLLQSLKGIEAQLERIADAYERRTEHMQKDRKPASPSFDPDYMDDCK